VFILISQRFDRTISGPYQVKYIYIVSDINIKQLILISNSWY